MSKKRKVKAIFVGKGDYAAPRPRKNDKNPSAKKEDKYAGLEETFRRDRYGK